MATRYIDRTKETGTLTGANWVFTNASITVTESGAAGNAVAELAAGNYVRTNAGTQWYKVASVTDDDNFEITPAFQQANNTDTCKYNSENGTATANAFCHPNQYTTDEARSAGDIGKTRANQTHILAGVHIAFDENGTANSYIVLKGCDSVDDPWSDGSDVRPIIDFSTGGVRSAFRMAPSKLYWKIDHIKITGSSSFDGAVYLYAADGVIIEDCVIEDNGVAPSRDGLSAVISGGVLIKDCIFNDNFGPSLSVYSSTIKIMGCVFNGGASNGSLYGIYMSTGEVYVKNSTFGVTSDHGTADVAVLPGAFYGRNVKLDSATEVAAMSLPDSLVCIEDDEQTHLAFRSWQFGGNVERSIVVERSGAGGTAWSMLGEPDSNCGSEQPLYIIGNWLKGIPIYLDGTAQTITIYAYATSWTVLPTVNQFVVELEHYEGAADWDIDVTADTFAANDQWESFAITLTPGAAGPAYLRVYLKDYEDGTEKIYIDPKPVIN